LEDLREASGDVVELKEKLAQAEKKAEEVDKLVCFDSLPPRFPSSARCSCADFNHPNRKEKLRSYSVKIHIFRQEHTAPVPAFLRLATPTHHLPHC
jgi:hypothetical protein